MRIDIALSLVVATVVLPLAGCLSNITAKMMVKAPNQQHVPAIVRIKAYAEQYDALYTKAWRVPVGPPEATLSVAVIEPDDYNLTTTIKTWTDKNGQKRGRPEMNWVVPPRPSTDPPKVKGTIILLHGYMGTKEDVVHWALALAEAGYRAVLPDLRGQGRSTGPWIGYGAFEANDLKQLLDDLQARGLAENKVGVLGISYGASIGLLWAARDSRVGAVVALAPFSNAERSMMEFARGTKPRLASMLSDDDFARAAERAAILAGFSWEDTDVLKAVERLQAPVFYFHGSEDIWVPPDHSRQLFAHTASIKEIGILDGDNHISLSMRLDPMTTHVLAWFEKWLNSSREGAPRSLGINPVD